MAKPAGYSPIVNESGLIVVGSGPAGVGAAESFREHNDAAPVTIVTTDGDVPYARPPLSKEYLRGESDDVELHEAQWYAERSIELVADATVDSVDLADRCVVVDRRRYHYQSLVLACGASPSSPPVPGGELALQLRSHADAAALRRAAADAESAVVIGAGFIGCEAAASLAKRGLRVTVVAPDAAPQTKRLGPEAAHRLLGLLDDAGVRYLGGVEVKTIHDRAVALDDGTRVDADLVLAATGVAPESDLAAAAGLKVDQSRIVVGADMQTSCEGVYAAGDVALAYNATARRYLAVEHWQDAADQGAIAGACAAGQVATWAGVPGFWSTIGDTTIKYHAWGDGYQYSRLIQRDNGFTVWYESDGAAVGVLTCNTDEDYDLGEHLISERKPAPLVDS
ncbi:MAG: 3-phenylpropionate/trans-cinnamate dioxygenase ferredoxin reductase component [Mycobacterium sp.]|jgi:NADPH-dependent 2,4-dienoyl-CoA reductase/sulfur reductase-like enzyme|nr:3-phenylpropionate/trans-cinnamate dioxygenase ferredoxin reductase component [Mycobacterium sp.]